MTACINHGRVARTSADKAALESPQVAVGRQAALDIIVASLVIKTRRKRIHEAIGL